MAELPEVPELIKPKPVRPWDMFNKNMQRVEDKIHEERMSICLECPFLIKATKQCKKCGCFMEMKTKLADATCPERKWDAVVIDKDNMPFKTEN